LAEKPPWPRLTALPAAINQSFWKYSLIVLIVAVHTAGEADLCDLGFERPPAVEELAIFGHLGQDSSAAFLFSHLG